MKDIVSFETAKRLKEAGFPQHISNNDCWYAANGDCFLQRLGGSILLGGEMPITREVDAPFFAPTALDILSAMQGVQLTDFFGVWVVSHPKNEAKEWRNDDAAEACAEAWLQLNEKC